jgi:hypothetical protein
MSAPSTGTGADSARIEPDVARVLARRLQTAFVLHDTGVAMKRAQLRRDSPAATEQEIGERLAAWLSARPGAPYGDAEGTPKPADAS